MAEVALLHDFSILSPEKTFPPAHPTAHFSGELAVMQSGAGCLASCHPKKGGQEQLKSTFLRS